MGEFMGVCPDGATAMLGSPSEFVARITQKLVQCSWISIRDPSRGSDIQGSICWNERQAFHNHTSRHAVNRRLFANLCKDMGYNHQTLLVYGSVRWLSEAKILVRANKMRDELKLFSRAHEKQHPLSFTSKGLIWRWHTSWTFWKPLTN